MPDVAKGNIAVFTNPSHDLKVVATEIPVPKEGEVIVHVRATGICGRSATPDPRFSPFAQS
jgi:D-arabinose 1-dehydrogenase-like Zn-dependent alcohol dehydrogenase